MVHLAALRSKPKPKVIIRKKESLPVIEEHKSSSQSSSESFSGSHNSAFSDSEESDPECERDKLIFSHEECLKMVLKDLLIKGNYL